MFKNNNIYYTAFSWTMRIILVLSPLIAKEYHLDIGNNIISYPFEISQAIEDAIPEQYLDNIVAISSNGKIKQYIDGTWYGSLKTFDSDNDYLLYIDKPFSFIFNEPDNEDVYDSDDNTRYNFPDLFTYNQSIYQSFYFIKSASILDSSLVAGEDWIGAFYGDICIGSRKWTGMYTDIPVMGFDENSPETEGYIIEGEYPQFVVYDASEDVYYDALSFDNFEFEGAITNYELALQDNKLDDESFMKLAYCYLFTDLCGDDTNYLYSDCSVGVSRTCFGT